MPSPARYAALIALLAGAGLASAQSVPPSEAERRAQAKRSSPTLDALDIVTDVKKGVHTVPKAFDLGVGGPYKEALGKYGKVLKGADLGVDIANGYYRDGSAGVARAVEKQAWSAAKTGAIEVMGGAAAGYYGLPAAPVAAAAVAGYAIGTGIDALAGPTIFNHTLGPAYDLYDRTVLQPQRDANNEALYQRLRERHQQARAQNEAAAAARQSYAPSSPEPDLPSGPSPMDQLLSTLVQPPAQPAPRTQPPPAPNPGPQRWVPYGTYSPPGPQPAPAPSPPPPAPTPVKAPPKPAPKPEPPGNGMHKPDSFCSVAHKPGVCPGKR